MAGGYDTDTVSRLETNLDDLSPEVLGSVMEKLLTAGALDVFFTPVQMKKNRPGVQLSVLCADESVEALADMIFNETTAFGLRIDKIARLKLQRRFETVSTEFGEVSVKLGLRNGQILQVAPEFESCRALSEKTGQPLRAIYAAATQAFAARE